MGSVGDLARLMNVDMAYLGFLLAKAGVVVRQDGGVDLDLAVKQLSRVLAAMAQPAGAQMTLPLPPVGGIIIPEKEPLRISVAAEAEVPGPREPAKSTVFFRASRLTTRTEAKLELERHGLEAKLMLTGHGMGYLQIGKAIASLTGITVDNKQRRAYIAVSLKTYEKSQFSLACFYRRANRPRNSERGVLLYTREEMDQAKYKEEKIGTGEFARFEIQLRRRYLLAERVGLLIARK